ncbi:Hypothetical predicted protein [Octopus vulgaris]|uniref:Uncharacterized protein n=1 Tax=Octopus vulgaris TaxID=6645 RepID=A0AA36BIC8_OCTVU|nr:Hypothetical predicted protein [Octopus vulgaris]
MYTRVSSSSSSSFNIRFSMHAQVGQLTGAGQVEDYCVCFGKVFYGWMPFLTPTPLQSGLYFLCGTSSGKISFGKVFTAGCPSRCQRLYSVDWMLFTWHQHQ